MTHRSPQSTSSLRQRGLSTVGLVITLVFLGVVGFTGWYGYCYYQVLDRQKKLEKSLEDVHRYRGAHRVTRDRVLNNAFEKIRAAGGKLSKGDVSLRMDPLTLENAGRLSAMLRQKLSLACHFKSLGTHRDRRIDQIKRGFENAGRRAPEPPVRLAMTAPINPGGPVTCTAEQMESFDYSFVQLTAKIRIQVGLVSRGLTLNRKFYLPQSPTPGAPAGGRNDETDDDDSE
ncbi:MAG: hypothetical protein ABI333_07235 [bacterium]